VTTGPTRESSSVVGVLLAAGSGERFGGPKALARDADGTSWLLRSVQALRPCAELVVVLGAEAERAAALLPMSVSRVRADDWAEGMGASLRAGLTALAPTDHDAALVSLVDLPDVDAAVVARLVGSAGGRDDLARAAYDGVPGHPVLIGRDHWAGVVEGATGDRGARDYLAAHHPRLVECGDLATGVDVDSR
jgi:CTP:molybdopterin cytidylyltransferase MocA